MYRIASFILAAAFVATVGVMPAKADEMGGSGFSVPQDEWLWGVEGLVRTPVDLSGGFGIGFFGYDFEGESQIRDATGPSFDRDGDLDFEPRAIEGGLRVAGGIGYWNCCVLIEPAMSFRGQDFLGDDRTDDTPRTLDNGPGDWVQAELEVKHGWELGFGPQISWMVPEDMGLIGRLFGGSPLVFYPYIGVAHTEFDVEISISDNGAVTTNDRDFEEDSLMLGFDLDFPLPGSHWSFTHSLTFGFRWTDSNDQHDMGPFQMDGTPFGPTMYSSCASGAGGLGGDAACVNFDRPDGWKVGLYYRVTWNDFEGFFKRNIFGPAN